MADIFISHSGADNDLADQIKTWLERDRASWSVFFDKHPKDGILAGQGWQDRLRSELQSCRLVLAIITPDWLASRWCFTEAVTATFRGKDFVGVLPGPLPDSALELAPYGITVNAVCPGLVKTAILDDFTEEKIEQLRQGTPLKRAGKPEEIGRTCVFLASDDGAWITGIALPVDGGWLARVHT